MAENDAGMSRVVCVNKGWTETVRELSHSTLAEEGIHVILPESRSDVQRHELSRISQHQVDVISEGERNFRGVRLQAKRKLRKRLRKRVLAL